MFDEVSISGDFGDQVFPPPRSDAKTLDRGKVLRQLIITSVLLLQTAQIHPNYKWPITA